MIVRKVKGDWVVFRRGDEVIGLKRESGMLGNARFQEWHGDFKIRDYFAGLDKDTIEEFINKAQLSDDEFDMLKELIARNVIVW